MGAETNTTIATLTVLKALQARIAEIEWQPPARVKEAAFHKVELFDMTDLETALQELFAFKDRICLVVLDTENYESATEGSKQHSAMVRRVELLFTDRSFAKRQIALEGNEKTPGVYALKELLVPAVCGKMEFKEGETVVGRVAVKPLEGELMLLEGKKRDELTGRVAWRQAVEIIGGELVFELGRAPIDVRRTRTI